MTSRRHRRLPSIWPDRSSLAEGETVIVMNERVVEAVNAGDPTEAFFACPRNLRFWQLGRYRRVLIPADSRSKRLRRSLVAMAAVQADKPGVRHHLERDETLEAALE